MPRPPTALKRHGKAAWQRYWSLGAPWLSPTTDLAIVTRLCEAYDEREELRRLVRKYGHLVAKVVDEAEVDDPGAGTKLRRIYAVAANPAVGQLRKLEELITRYEGLCGFTPSDRSRLGLAEVKTASALEQLMARQQERRAARGAARPASGTHDEPVIDMDPL